MNFKQFELLLKEMNPKDALLVKGIHGIGKSQAIAKFAKEIEYTLYDIRLAQYEVGDLIGLPKIINEDDKENLFVNYAPPKWLLEASKGKSILFFDEIPRAAKDVLQIVFQIVLDRKYTANGVQLADDVYVICAGNFGDQYQHEELDPALVDRFNVQELSPGNTEWFNWAEENNLNPYVINFLKENIEYVDPTMGDIRIEWEPHTKYPSRRSWEKLSNQLNSMVAKYGGGMRNKEVEVMLFATGFVGNKVGNAFTHYFKENFKKVTPKDVYEGNFKAIDYEDHAAMAMLVKELQKDLKKIYKGKNPSRANFEHIYNIGKFIIEFSKQPKCAETLASLKDKIIKEDTGAGGIFFVFNYIIGGSMGFSDPITSKPINNSEKYIKKIEKEIKPGMKSIMKEMFQNQS